MAKRIVYAFLLVIGLLNCQKITAQYNQPIDGCRGEIVTLDLNNNKPFSFKLLHDTFFVIIETNGSHDTVFVYSHANPSVKTGSIPVLCNDTSAIDLSKFGSKEPAGGKGIWYLNSKPTAIVNNFLYPDKLSAGHYTLVYTVYDRFGCKNSDTSSLFIKQCRASTVEGQTWPDMAFDLFPNPVSEILAFDFCQIVKEEMYCSIYNINGTKTLDFHIPVGVKRHSLDVKALVPGVYMLVLRSGNAIVQKRIVMN